MSKYFLHLFAGILLAFFLFGCGSSRKDDDAAMTEDNTERQQELNLLIDQVLHKLLTEQYMTLI